MAFKFYNCDGVNDKDWGCGYRCIQNVESFLKINVDSIEKIADNLLSIGINPFIGGKTIFTAGDRLAFCDGDWIEKYFSVFSSLSVEKLELKQASDYLKIKDRIVENIAIIIIDGGIYCISENSQGTLLIDPHVYVEVDSIPPLSKDYSGGVGYVQMFDFLTKNMEIIGLDKNDFFLDPVVIYCIKCVE